MKKGIAFVDGNLLPKKYLSLGTAYRVVNNKIDLVNIIYIPSIDEFGCNYCINLPYQIIRNFNKQPYDIDDVEIMEMFGIRRVCKWIDAIEQYKKENKVTSFNNKKYLNDLKKMINQEEMEKEEEIPQRKYISLKK